MGSKLVSHKLITCEHGSATLEFAICLPVVAMFIGLIIAFASYSGYQNRCQDLASAVLREVVAISPDNAGPADGGSSGGGSAEDDASTNASESSERAADYAQRLNARGREIASALLNESEEAHFSFEVNALENEQFIEVHTVLDLRDTLIGTFIHQADARIVGHVER